MAVLAVIYAVEIWRGVFVPDDYPVDMSALFVYILKCCGEFVPHRAV
jgi:hypothetical protein